MLTVIMGTPQEVHEFLKLNRGRPVQINELAIGVQSADAQGNGELTADIVKRALADSPLENLTKVVRGLCETTDWINRDDLTRATGLSRQAIAGVNGVFGGRLNSEPGWTPPARRSIRLVIERRWRNGTQWYRATPLLRQAFEAARAAL
jgi:hypothetical protein